MNLTSGGVHKVKNRANPWRYQFKDLDSGRSFCKSGFRTKDEAFRAMLSKREELYRFGSEITPVTFTEAYTKYLEAMQGDNAASWLKNKRAYLRHFQEQFGADCPLRAVTEFDIQKYKLARRGPVTESSVDRELSVLKHFFQWAKKARLVRGNPAADIKKYEPDNRRGISITHEQAAALIRESEPELRARILLALGYGLRSGEISNLKKTDLTPATGSIVVFREKKRRTDKSIIQLPADLVELITGLPRAASPARRAKREEYLFPHITNRKAWASAKARAGVPDEVRFHDLRHTAASWALAEGGTLEAIRRFLNHSNITTTARYLHAEDAEVSRLAAGNLSKIMGA